MHFNVQSVRHFVILKQKKIHFSLSIEPEMFIEYFLTEGKTDSSENFEITTRMVEGREKVNNCYWKHEKRKIPKHEILNFLISK
jgi:hypothetical protein